MDLKKRVLNEVEAVMSPNAIFATNSSSLSIEELADGARNPQRVIGMHFFNPVSKMPLVEVSRLGVLGKLLGIFFIFCIGSRLFEVAKPMMNL